jgi:carbon-monoxide dehydrogenase large subunit
MTAPDGLPSTDRPKFIGARVQRLEDPRLLTGAGAYVADHRFDRLLHVALRRSDRAHARIGAIDLAPALALPGVIAAFTGEDLAGMTAPVFATSRMRDYCATALWPLARGKVRHVGEAVVAVLAESRYVAEDAAEAIDVQLEPLPAPVDVEDSSRDGAPRLHDEAGSNVLASRRFARGDATRAMAEAAVRVGGRFRFRRKSPVAIESRACAATYDRGSRSLTLYSSTQVPGILHDVLVDSLGIPGNRLRVVAPDVGGGFGSKTSLYPEEALVCALARHLGRAVKWTSDRMEDLMSTYQAFDEIVDAELGLAADGTILALRADVVGDVGAYSVYPWTAAIEPVQVASFLPGPYRIANYEARVRAVATAKTTVAAYRGVGRPIAAFVMERLIDMASRRLAHDPKDLRLRNLVGDDEFPYKVATGLVWDRSAFRAGLMRACETIGYDALRREQAEARAAGRWMGIGLATYAELTGLGSRISVAPGMPINTGTETAAVEIDATGAITARFGVTSQGQGLHTTLAQVVAEELGSRIEDVRVIIGDTAGVAHSTGTYASRAAVLAGGAAILAARAVREKVVRCAAHLFEAAPEDIVTASGAVFVAGTDRSMSLEELARAVYSDMGRVPKEIRDDIGNLEATKVYDPFFGTASSATHVAVVDIDPETYRVRVVRYLVVEDSGRIINPLIADGQAHGGVAQGIGAALYEEVVHDEDGQILTASLVDYVVPSAAEIPPLDVVHLETVSPSTLGGFRGLGEGGTIGAPAAVANAVADALSPLGIEIFEVPVTPERLFRLIEAARRRD